MYGPFVRDKFPPRKHLSSILDIEAGHPAERTHHVLLWAVMAIAACSAAASWYFGSLSY